METLLHGLDWFWILKIFFNEVTAYCWLTTAQAVPSSPSSWIEISLFGWKPGLGLFNLTFDFSSSTEDSIPCEQVQTEVDLPFRPQQKGSTHNPEPQAQTEQTPRPPEVLQEIYQIGPAQVHQTGAERKLPEMETEIYQTGPKRKSPEILKEDLQVNPPRKSPEVLREMYFEGHSKQGNLVN